MTLPMLEVLRALRRAESPRTAAEVGRACGHWRGNSKPTRDGRSMSPAQRVMFPLAALVKRGLVTRGVRFGVITSTVFELSEAGRTFAAEHQ